MYRSEFFMLLNKITNALKANLGNFLEPFKKIAQDLSQISAYAKDPNKSSLAILEKRVDPPCTEGQLRELIGDTLILEREIPAIERLIGDEAGKIKKIKGDIKTQEAEIKTLNQEIDELRRRMTSIKSSLWDRGKLVLDNRDGKPIQMLTLGFSLGTFREAKLLADSQLKQSEESRKSSLIMPQRQEISKHQRQIDSLRKDQAQFVDKIPELKTMGENCAQELTQ